MVKKRETLLYLNWVFEPDGTFCDLDEDLGDISLERLVKNYEYIYNPYGLYDKLFEKKREKGVEGVDIEELEFLCHLSLFWNVVTLEFLNFFVGINRLPGLSDRERNILIELSLLGSISENELLERMKRRKINIDRGEDFHRSVKYLEEKDYINRKRYSRKEGRKLRGRSARVKGNRYGVLSLNLSGIMENIYPYDRKMNLEQEGRPELTKMIISPKAINVTKQIENLKRLVMVEEK